MEDGRHIENVFWLYLGAILADQHEISNRDEGPHADIGRVTKSAIVALSPYLSCELSNFDQIW